MLTHIVIWKYRADVEDELRREHIARLKGLSTVVDGIVSLNVGSDVLGLPRSYDTGLVVVFRDHSALDAYTIHPDHVLAADYGRAISEHVVSVDFLND